MTKLTKRDYKTMLPDVLYKSTMKGKRGKGDLMKSVNTRLRKNEYVELVELLNTIGVKRSSFVRHAIKKYVEEVKEIMSNYEKEV